MRCSPDLIRLITAALVIATVSCRSPKTSDTAMERISVSADRREFVYAHSKTPFHPWGVNYGNRGRLMEDFWDTDWQTLTDDFAEMKSLGVNVVRVHLQFGKFMSSADQPNAAALKQLGRLLALAESNRL